MPYFTVPLYKLFDIDQLAHSYYTINLMKSYSISTPELLTYLTPDSPNRFFPHQIPVTSCYRSPSVMMVSSSLFAFSCHTKSLFDVNYYYPMAVWLGHCGLANLFS